MRNDENFRKADTLLGQRNIAYHYSYISFKLAGKQVKTKGRTLHGYLSFRMLGGS